MDETSYSINLKSLHGGERQSFVTSTFGCSNSALAPSKWSRISCAKCRKQNLFTPWSPCTRLDYSNVKCSPNCFELQSPPTPVSSRLSTGPRSLRPTTPTMCCNSSNSLNNTKCSNNMSRMGAVRRGRPRRSRINSPTRRWRSGPRNR